MNAPSSAITAPSDHVPMVSAAEPVRAATMDGLMKIPDPMMPPTTSIVPEKRPRDLEYVGLSVMRFSYRRSTARLQGATTTASGGASYLLDHRSATPRGRPRCVRRHQHADQD